MYEFPTIPASQTEKFSSILVLNVIDKAELSENSEKRASFSKKIEQIISQYDGKIISWLNSEIIITFSSNHISEKHASRAYFCYQAINNIVDQYSLSAKAFLNSANICVDGAICWDSTPQTTRDVLLSVEYPKDKKILFSESSVQLLEGDLKFEEIYKRNKKQKLKFYSLENPEIKSPNFRFIGRAIESELIQKSLVENNHVCICGPAGIGKTGLVEHFLEKSNFFIIRYSFYKNNYGGLYRQLFDELLSLSNIANLNSTHDKFKALKYLTQPTEEEEIFLSQIYEDPYVYKNHSDTGVTLFVKCIDRIAPNKNICLYFDDIQWAFEEFEEFCNSIDSPTLKIISTSRNIPRNKEKCVVINLKPLQQHDIKDIVQELIPYDMITQDLINSISQQTSGNPYYLKEMIKSFLRQQRDSDNEGRDVPALETNNQLPLSLKNLLKHQMDLLSEELKETLQIGSCIGQKFTISFIQKICGAEEAEVRNILNALCDADFLKFSMRTNSYEFIHSLKEKNVYESIPRANRISLHRRISDTLQNQRNANASPLLSQQLFNAEMWRAAYKENLRDSRLYIKNLEPRLAMEAITRCMTSAKKMNALKKVRSTRLRLMLNTVYFILGEIKSAQKFITPVKDLFSNKELLRYPEIWNAALNELTFFYWISAEYDLTLKIIDQAEREFSSVLNSATAGALIIRRIGVHSDIGKLKSSNEEIDKLLAIQQNSDFADWASIFPVRPVLLALKCRNHAYLKQFREFETHAVKALSLSINQDNPSTQIFTLCYVADGYIQLGNLIMAYSLLEEAIGLMNKSHIYVLKSYIISLMGYCEAASGMYTGISKISHAIYSAQIDGRLCRLPLFYFYMGKSLSHLSDKGAKRYLVRGLKLAKTQKEEWVIQQIYLFADDMKIELEKPKDANRNIINLSKYISRRANES